MKRAVIVLPSYNERENLKTLIPAIFSITKKIPQWDVHILVVDDTSPDGSADEVKLLKRTYPTKLHLLMGKKQGLGKAYRRGFVYATGKLAADTVFEMDADWQHDPALIPEFLKKIDDGSEFVIGARFIPGGSIPKRWGVHRKIFSLGANTGMRLGFMKPSIHDWTSGYRAINSTFLKETHDNYEKYDGYIFQIALLDNAIKKHLVISEIPLRFGERTEGESKILPIPYILNIIMYVLRHSAFLKYCVVGFLAAGVDFGGSYILIEKAAVAIWLSTMISAEFSVLVNFVLNNYWSFAHKKHSKSSFSFLKALGQFHVVQIGSILLQTVLMHYTTDALGEQYWYIYKALIIGFVVIPYSYFMYNKFVWKDKKKANTR